MIAFELITESADDLATGLCAAGRSNSVYVADGLGGVWDHALPGDLVLLDPFHVHERGRDLTAVETFTALASRMVATILWYAIYDPADAGAMISAANESAYGWGAEIVGDTSEGGLAGCGFRTANLSARAEASAQSILSALAATMSVVRPGLRLL